MNDEGFTAGLVLGIIAATCLWLVADIVTDPYNTAYTKGITDCQQGTTSYTVTVGPEGVDTTYVYKP